MKSAEKNGKGIYLTGHSLGGHLAVVAYSSICDMGKECLVERVETFNAVGISNSDNAKIKCSNKIVQNYTCCDVARWACLTNGLYYPGISPKLQIKVNLDKNKSEHQDARTDYHTLLNYISPLLAQYINATKSKNKVDDVLTIIDILDKLNNDPYVAELVTRVDAHGIDHYNVTTFYFPPQPNPLPPPVPPKNK